MSERKISRRTFIETSMAEAAAVASFPAFPSYPPNLKPPNGPEGDHSDLRTVRSLNEGWKFRRQTSPGGGTEPEFLEAIKPAYNDSSWESVWLPHTWDATPDNPFATSGHFRGIGWYRNRLQVPPEWQGRMVWLHFKGAFQVTNVWVNGRHAGEHVGGYTSFAFDVTPYLLLGKPNLLAVKVDSVPSPFIAPTDETNVAQYGGIYRSVFLEVTNPLRIRYNGTWVTFEGTEHGPVIRIRTWVVNPGPSAREVRLESSVLNAQGQRETRLEAAGEIGAGQEKGFDQRTDAIGHAQLWSPDSPYLYRLVSTVWENGRAVDRYVTRFGIRFMGHDPAQGFMLNGEPINLHGVDRRQDYGFLGDAVPEAIGVRDVQLMKEMGANFLRTSHYPQDPAVLDACDELGILIWEEIPNIKIRMYPPSQDNYQPVYATRFPWPLMNNLKQQLKEMIERDRNRPSIIMWGLGDDLGGYQYPADFAALSDYSHSLDSTRWTAGRVPAVTDISYSDEEDIHDPWVKHQCHPERKYIWNEWGAVSCERGREGPPYIVGKELLAVGDSTMALIQEGYLMQWNAMPWLGTAKWCMFDCGEVNGTVTRPLWDPWEEQLALRWPFNDYLGICDMWRLPKNAYYLFQSQWTEKPVVHIVSHWTWPGHEGQGRQVRVYSNCDTVELFLNGQTLGVQQPASQERVWEDFRLEAEKYANLEYWNNRFTKERLPGAHLLHPPFIWDQIPYQPGTLVAIGQKGSARVKHELRTADTARGITLKTDRRTWTVGKMDISFIEADVVDEHGTIVPTAEPWIEFSVQGPGRLLGGATVVDAVSGMAAINVQSTGQPGQVTVKAVSDGLEPGLVELVAASS